MAPALAATGIRLSSWDDLDDDDEKFLVETFEQRIFPVLTPLAVDPGHPFPYISNLSLNLAVLLRDPVTGERRFARVKVPDLLPRFVVMPDGERFVPLEQVIAAHLDQLFPGMEVEATDTFRVSRNADLTLEEEEADDLLAAVEVELRRRQFGRAVRLEVSDAITAEVRELPAAGARSRGERHLLAGWSARPGWPVVGPRARPARSEGSRRTSGSPRPGSTAARRSVPTSSRRCGRATSSSTIPTTPSARRWRSSSGRPPPTPTCWPSR